jgi:coenzyme Q-binding protein COQ10
LVIRYSPEQLFDVVAAVDFYHGFVPWCQRSEIVKRNPDGSFDAELEIGFKFLVESYVSHVELDRPKRIKVFDLAYFFFYFVAFGVCLIEWIRNRENNHLFYV